MSTPPPAATAAMLALVALLPQLGAGVAEAVPPTCQGRPVTVEGAIGTEGDDVMLAPLNAWEGVEGRGGNDTICLVDGPDQGSRDPRFFADAGPGDDSISFEGTYYASVVLGAGADRFVGNDTGTTVYTGAYDSSLQANRYFGQADTEADVVTTGGGRDTIYSGDTAGFVANPDRLATGGSAVDTDTVFYAGRMTPEGELDNGTSRDLLFLVDAWGPGELAIDNVAGRAEVSGTEVLRWTGVGSFILQERPEALRFLGGAGADALTVGDTELPTPVTPMDVDVVTGGGRDRVSLAGVLAGRIALGGGRDHLDLGGCGRVHVRLDARLRCVRFGHRTQTTLSGVEGAYLRGRHVVAIGTPGPDQIEVYGRLARVSGRAGRDELAVERRDGIIDGGPGRDRCRGGIQRHCERRGYPRRWSRRR